MRRWWNACVPRCPGTGSAERGPAFGEAVVLPVEQTYRDADSGAYAAAESRGFPALALWTQRSFPWMNALGCLSTRPRNERRNLLLSEGVFQRGFHTLHRFVTFVDGLVGTIEFEQPQLTQPR